VGEMVEYRNSCLEIKCWAVYGHHIGKVMVNKKGCYRADFDNQICPVWAPPVNKKYIRNCCLFCVGSCTSTGKEDFVSFVTKQKLLEEVGY
jgi:hypothetical protein